MTEVRLTVDELRDMVRETVRETLVGVGMGSDDPVEMQLDFAHLRMMRKLSAEMQRKSLLTLVGLAVLGASTLLVLGIKQWITKG